MTKGYVIQELKDLQNSCDPEGAHVKADELICKFLERLGFEDIVKEYDKVPKWYA